VTRTRPRTNRAHGPWAAACLALVLAALGSPRALAFDAGREDIAAFVNDMSSRYGFDPAALRDVLSKAESRKSILDAMSRPAEKTLNWQEYRDRFITERRINRGVETYRDHEAALGKAAGSGVPAEIILGIIGVETFYGEVTGRNRVIDALATLAFDYPPRGPFFRGELEQYLLMTREESLDPLVPLGSYAGAMGVPQFMPSSFRSFAVDGDGDGHRNLWTDWPDVMSSVGNYLKEHGWKAGEPVMAAADVADADLAGLDVSKPTLTETVGSLRKRGIRFETNLTDDAPAMLIALSRAFGSEYRVGFSNFYAITRYNRSLLYASAVNDLAESIQAARARSLPPDDAASFAE
jgi:membrane-bound lytic murein transglycosylase B